MPEKGNSIFFSFLNIREKLKTMRIEIKIKYTHYNKFKKSIKPHSPKFLLFTGLRWLKTRVPEGILKPVLEGRRRPRPAVPRLEDQLRLEHVRHVPADGPDSALLHFWPFSVRVYHLLGPSTSVLHLRPGEEHALHAHAHLSALGERMVLEAMAEPFYGP